MVNKLVMQARLNYFPTCSDWRGTTTWPSLRLQHKSATKLELAGNPTEIQLDTHYQYMAQQGG